jgi:hypothetical protein
MRIVREVVQRSDSAITVNAVNSQRTIMQSPSPSYWLVGVFSTVISPYRHSDAEVMSLVYYDTIVHNMTTSLIRTNRSTITYARKAKSVRRRDF